MGGQACVFCGAAEYSRDVDFALLAEAENLARLKRALDEWLAEVIAAPPFAAPYHRVVGSRAHQILVGEYPSRVVRGAGAGVRKGAACGAVSGLGQMDDSGVPKRMKT